MSKPEIQFPVVISDSAQADAFLNRFAGHFYEQTMRLTGAQPDQIMADVVGLAMRFTMEGKNSRYGD